MVGNKCRCIYTVHKKSVQVILKGFKKELKWLIWVLFLFCWETLEENVTSPSWYASEKTAYKQDIFSCSVFRDLTHMYSTDLNEGKTFFSFLSSLQISPQKKALPLYSTRHFFYTFLFKWWEGGRTHHMSKHQLPWRYVTLSFITQSGSEPRSSFIKQIERESFEASFHAAQKENIAFDEDACLSNFKHFIFNTRRAGLLWLMWL